MLAVRTKTSKPADAVPSSKLDGIRKKLGHLTLAPRPPQWLDTKFKDLNAVMGNEAHGLKYGNLVEISGWSSAGKTALAMCLAALAQIDGALIIWVDLENSFDPEWAESRGLDLSKIVLIQPYVGRFAGEKEERLSTAQELCSEAEGVIKASYKTHAKMALIVDSMAAMLTAGEEAAGIENQNMNTGMDLSRFLNKLMRRWVGLAQTHNVMGLLINQLRQKPMTFGDPSYTVGGNAVPFYSHVRVRLRRAAKYGQLEKNKKIIGIQGYIENNKNKSGRERAKVGFKLIYGGPMEFLRFDKIAG